MSADRTIDPELPWGCWLRIQPRDHFKAVFVDDVTGQEWSTIREAFWRGRLRMPLRNDKVPEDQMEFLHGVLSQIARRQPSPRERAADMFHGSGQFCDWYFAWLHNQGLIDELEGRLTAEGWAVLHMLMATRPQPVRQDRPGRATVRQLTEVGLGPGEREARLARVERMSLDWGEGFRRMRIGAWPHVILVERGEGPVPVLQTTWSLRFDTDEQRDDFYEWLCVRLDRWPAWATLADGHPHLELTQHLLIVMSATLTKDAEARPGSSYLQGSAADKD
jgi:hypothetical protein